MLKRLVVTGLMSVIAFSAAAQPVETHLRCNAVHVKMKPGSKDPYDNLGTKQFVGIPLTVVTEVKNGETVLASVVFNIPSLPQFDLGTDYFKQQFKYVEATNNDAGGV